MLRSPSTSQEMTTRLINLALQKGGKDNVVARFSLFGTARVKRHSSSQESPAPGRNLLHRSPGATALGRPRSTKRARPVESTKMIKPPTITASKPRHYSFHAAAALVLGAAVSASGILCIA